MVESIRSVQFALGDKVAAVEDRMSPEAFRHMITEGRIAAGLARSEAEKAAAARAEQHGAPSFAGQNAMTTAVVGKMPPALFLEPPAK